MRALVLIALAAGVLGLLCLLWWPQGASAPRVLGPTPADRAGAVAAIEPEGPRLGGLTSAAPAREAAHESDIDLTDGEGVTGTVLLHGQEPASEVQVLCHLQHAGPGGRLGPGAEVGRTSTDEAGEFVLAVGPGDHIVTVIPSDPSYPLVVSSGCHAGQSLLIVLGVGASVSGLVRSTTGLPAGGEVEVYRESEYGRFACRRSGLGDCGQYLVDRLEAGRYVLEVHLAGFEPRWERFELREGVHLVRNIQIEAGVPIGGRVIDQSTQAPIAGASVGLDRNLRSASLTDTSGRFELHPGEGTDPDRLYARASGYAPKSVEPLDLGATDLVIELGPGARVRGEVQGLASPAVEASVLAAASWGAGEAVQQTAAVTNEVGAFVLEDLVPLAPHVLVVHALGTELAELTFETPPPGGEVDLGRILIEGGGSLVGAVRSVDGVGLAEHEIRAEALTADEGAPSDPLRAWLSSTRRTWTAEDGSFVLDRLPAGSYRVDARFLSEVGVWEDDRVVHVESGKETRVDFRVDRNESIGGVVLDAEGRAAGLATVTLFHSGRPQHVATVRAGSEGEFLFSGIPPGLYRAKVTLNRTYRQREGSVRSAGESFDGLRSGQVDLVLRLPEARAVSGFVVDAEHEVVAGYLVFALLPEFSVVDQALTDENGAFELTGVGRPINIQVSPTLPDPLDPSSVVIDRTEGLTVVEPMVDPGSKDVVIVLPYVVSREPAAVSGR